MEAAAYSQLIVWQKAMELVDLVYAAMRDQLSRAIVSIPSNIAEGNGRGSRADYAHFLCIARGSLYETLTQLEIAKWQGYVTSIEPFQTLGDEIRKMLSSMIAKLST